MLKEFQFIIYCIIGLVSWFKKVFILWSGSYSMRVRFLRKGEQRKFIEDVLKRTNCPSLRAFEQFGFGINYSTMKNYFSEVYLLPKDLFDKMCYIARVDGGDLKVEFVEDNWGRVSGGKKSRK